MIAHGLGQRHRPPAVAPAARPPGTTAAYAPTQRQPAASENKRATVPSRRVPIHSAGHRQCLSTSRSIASGGIRCARVSSCTGDVRRTVAAWRTCAVAVAAPVVWGRPAGRSIGSSGGRRVRSCTMRERVGSCTFDSIAFALRARVGDSSMRFRRPFRPFPSLAACGHGGVLSLVLLTIVTPDPEAARHNRSFTLCVCVCVFEQKQSSQPYRTSSNRASLRLSGFKCLFFLRIQEC